MSRAGSTYPPPPLPLLLVPPSTPPPNPDPQQPPPHPPLSTPPSWDVPLAVTGSVSRLTGPRYWVEGPMHSSLPLLSPTPTPFLSPPIDKGLARGN